MESPEQWFRSMLLLLMVLSLFGGFSVPVFAAPPCDHTGAVEALQSEVHGIMTESIERTLDDLEEEDEFSELPEAKTSLKGLKNSITITVDTGSIKKRSNSRRYHCKAKIESTIRDRTVSFPVLYKTIDTKRGITVKTHLGALKNESSEDFGMTPTFDYPGSRGDDSKGVTLENFRVVSESPHHLKIKVDYKTSARGVLLDPQPVKDGREVWRGFETDYRRLEKGEGTAELKVRYRTLNPQWGGENPPRRITTSHIRLRTRCCGGESREKTFEHQKTWTVDQVHEPSDTIPDNPELNTIEIQSLDRLDSTTYRVNYDYHYRSDHGPAIKMRVDALKDGRNANCCTYVTDLERGQHSASTRFSRDVDEIRQTPVTDQLRLTMRIGMSGPEVYSDTFERKINWLARRSEADSPVRGDSLQALRNRIIRVTPARTVDDDLLQQYLGQAAESEGVEAYRKLLNWYLDDRRRELRSSRESFNLALRVLLHAARNLSGSDRDPWLREQFSRLFKEGSPRDPLYRGGFDGTTFNRLYKLTKSSAINRSLNTIRIPNAYTHHPHNSTIQVSDQSLGGTKESWPVFIHFPKDRYLETVYLDRLLPEEFLDDGYDRLFWKQFGASRTYRYFTGDGDRSTAILYNLFETEDAWIPIQRENIEWLQLNLSKLSVPDASYNLELVSFPPRKNTDETLLEPAAVERKFDTHPGWLKRLAAEVEKARTTGNYRRFAPEGSSSDTRVRNEGYRILAGAYYLMAGRYSRARTLLSKLEYPDNPYYRKWMQMYRLTPLSDLGWEAYLEFRSATPEGKVNVLEDHSLSVPGRYSLARVHWEMGRYEAAERQFRKVLGKVRPGEVLWDESTLYRVSSLYRLGRTQAAIRRLEHYLYTTRNLRSGGHKPFFFEVEGIFTNGLPMRHYLISWLTVMKDGRRAWWYERVGKTAEPIPYYRYFATRFEDEPIGRIVTESIREATGTFEAIVNHKGLRGGLPKGPIRRNQLHLVLPWNNRIHNYHMTPPDRLTEKRIRQTFDSIPRPPNPVRGRGPGSNYSSESFEVKDYLTRVVKQGDPPDGIPVLAMPEFLSRMAERFASHRWRVHRTTFSVSSLRDRDMLERYIRNHSPLHAPTIDGLDKSEPRESENGGGSSELEESRRRSSGFLTDFLDFFR